MKLAEAYRNSHALVIGIDAYRDYQPLSTAVKGAKAIAEILSKDFGFDVELLVDDHATLAEIRDKRGCLTKGEVDDRVIVYFAGHGVTRTDRFGAKHGYLAPYDARKGEYDSLYKISDFVNIEFFPAKHILFLLDACFTGLALTRAEGDQSNLLHDLMTHTAFQVISAGLENQTVSDTYGPGGHSIFTGLLIEGLGGEASKARGLLTADQLGIFLRDKVGSHTKSQQTPRFGRLLGSEGGDLVLRRERKPVLATEPTYAYPGAAPTISLDRKKPQRTSKEFLPLYENSIALVVGIEQYKYLPPLQNCTRNAEAIATALKSKFGFDVTLHLDAAATRTSILKYIDGLSFSTGINDRVFIYLAGHGITRHTAAGRQSGYIGVADTEPGSYISAVPMQEIADMASHIPAKHLMITIDACFGGLALTGIKGSSIGGKVPEKEFLLGRRFHMLLVAGGKDEVITDIGGPSGLSPFTGIIVDRLVKSEDDEIITGKILGTHVQRTVLEITHARQTPQFGVLEGSDPNGDYIFQYPEQRTS
jgi:uncharacterized caspase-like protein